MKGESRAAFYERQIAAYSRFIQAAIADDVSWHSFWNDHNIYDWARILGHFGGLLLDE